MSSYRYSSDANSDIEEIALYLFDLNPTAAHRFLDSLEETCELLAAQPLIGRSRPELADDLRSFPVGNYLIFYAPTANGIDVARVIYGGRDLPGIFGR
ncbi:MAG: type II toxin-antitoxin system RelE/ParE family toxin [Verrucomicrobiales bacterium]|nr:type II toxin-antitoxin system RelE/ParE family toxin [Verrucomicrobiales bacterium]